MRRFLVLLAAMACLEGCSSCQGKPAPSAASTDAGSALNQPPPPAPAVESPPAEPPIPERAMQLHAQGRQQGTEGQFGEALKSFQQAREAAPTWPLPLADIGLTYLFMKEDARALEAYEELDKLVPQGIPDSKQMLESLRRERDGRVPKGTLREFLEAQTQQDPQEVHRRLEALTRKAPAFYPAWQELALSAENPEEGERLLSKALALEPDIESRGELLLHQAILLRRRGQHAEGRKQLQALIDDSRMPPSIIAEAREQLSIPDSVQP